MDPTLLLDRVVDDERLTRDLDEPEAVLMLQTLTARVRELAARSTDLQQARGRVDALCRRARQVAAVTALVRDAGVPEARALAGQYGLPWPAGATTPAVVLRDLLNALD